ncbi:MULTISPECIES: helix-turn-helix transcriptional regulator [Streptomyces]|uniref:Helix-turn-helix domain-containing protein n=1 Tax=Streptomyces solicathayae TaxID=3081768 RepID=A0ABZ0LNJ1_9ACTN|nr:helix-turn-helix domain-containing protein [Streptomyces sp. HUAS YS2]WOX21063.1 helix-turn-helix domain-containing protein [Streptomyces sp. HUAS YS2]
MLSPKQLAQLLGVPIGTVYDWNHDGTGPRYARVGKHVRYSIPDIEAWLAARHVDRSDRRGAA